MLIKQYPRGTGHCVVPGPDPAPGQRRPQHVHLRPDAAILRTSMYSLMFKDEIMDRKRNV